jgi:hypothetical protein
MDSFTVISPTAILGYGFPEDSFSRGMEKKPDLIAVDGGSTDPGPYYLGSGKSFTDRDAVRRDLEIILQAAFEAKIPTIIGTAGGSGARQHVDWTVEIIREIIQKRCLSFRLGVIYADIPKDVVRDSLITGRITPLPGAPNLSEETIGNCARVVAQMGPEPVYKALDYGCDVIVCGRCYDPVAFAAPAIQRGFDPGLAIHMGKILECAAIAADPPDGRDSVLGTLNRDSFVLEALSPARSFTRISTAAHSLYEKSDPYRLPGPGGCLDLRETAFEELEDGRVRVIGTTFEVSNEYRVKLEGASLVGHRSIAIAGTRDPILIGQIDEVLYSVKKLISDQLSQSIPQYRLMFHVYGKNGVMGEMEPLKDAVSHELGLVIEAIASSQREADTVCSMARSTLMHFGYPGRISTAGNLAFPYSPSDIACGPVYRFSIYHLMETSDPELFPLEIEELSP